MYPQVIHTWPYYIIVIYADTKKYILYNASMYLHHIYKGCAWRPSRASVRLCAGQGLDELEEYGCSPRWTQKSGVKPRTTGIKGYRFTWIVSTRVWIRIWSIQYRIYMDMDFILYIHGYMMWVYICIYIHTYVRTYIRTYVRTYMHACMHTYIHTFVY